MIQTSFEKKAGLSLVVFTMLMTFTMVLHPAGGSVEYLLKIINVIIITHAIAILSLPFALAGFWGLTKTIGTGNFLSILAFSFISLGLVAVMIAAAANGLVMPLFIQSYKEAPAETIALIKPVLSYSFSVNHAFDYIYTGAFCLAILCWSITIIHTKKLPPWIGWFGIITSIAAVGIFVTGMGMPGIQAFRLFVSCIVLWILVVGIVLSRRRGASQSANTEPQN
ncbi:MAG: hypothetical protein ACXWV1_15915 [Chitinophagaceae bacterium]